MTSASSLAIAHWIGSSTNGSIGLTGRHMNFTHLITRRRDVRPLHVDIDPRPTTIETRSLDFRKVSGLNFGFGSIDTDLGTGKVLQRTSVRTVKVNSD
jgi:hypothetical protein